MFSRTAAGTETPLCNSTAKRRTDTTGKGNHCLDSDFMLDICDAKAARNGIYQWICACAVMDVLISEIQHTPVALMFFLFFLKKHGQTIRREPGDDFYDLYGGAAFSYSFTAL